MEQTEAKKQLILGRPPQDDDELWEVVRLLWGISIPRTPICPHHQSPFDAFADAYFARSPFSIWKASRGMGGKTNTLGLLALTEAVTLGAQVTVLGGSAAQSLRVYEISLEAWAHKNAPTGLLVDQPNKYSTNLTSGAWIRALTASQRSVRGQHPQRLRLDEIDEMELEILEAAQGQPMSKNGIQTQTVASSTHQYPDKTMTEMLKRAKEKGYPVYEWCWRETVQPHGWLPVSEVERKRSEVSQAMWDIEFDMQEPSFEGRAIDAEKVDEMFSLSTHPKVSGEVGKEYLFEKYNGEGVYITGIDWAKQRDYTVIATLRTDVEPWRVVAFERTHREAWGDMVKKAQDRVAKYPGKLVHDATGIGNVVEDYIEIDSIPYVITGSNKKNLFSEYISACERGLIQSPMVESMYQDHKYAGFDDIYGNGHTPDSMVAMALAWAERGYKFEAIAPLIDFVRQKSPWSV